MGIITSLLIPLARKSVFLSTFSLGNRSYLWENSDFLGRKSEVGRGMCDNLQRNTVENLKLPFKKILYIVLHRNMWFIFLRGVFHRRSGKYVTVKRRSILSPSDQFWSLHLRNHKFQRKFECLQSRPTWHHTSFQLWRGHLFKCPGWGAGRLCTALRGSCVTIGPFC